MILVQEEEVVVVVVVVVVEAVMIVLKETDMSHLFMTPPFNQSLKKVRLKDPKVQPSSEEVVEGDNSSVIPALADHLVANTNDPAVVVQTGVSLVRKLRKLLPKVPLARNLQLLKNLQMLMIKKRRKNLLLKNLRKQILLNGNDNSKKRKLLYKINLNNNTRKSVRLMMETPLHSRILFSIRKRMRRLPQRVSPKRQRKKLKRKKPFL